MSVLAVRSAIKPESADAVEAGVRRLEKFIHLIDAAPCASGGDISSHWKFR